ncbi:hypothetical protein [Spirosoma areae]
MSLQTILNSGHVDETESTDVLEEFVAKATPQVALLRESADCNRPCLAETIARTQDAIDQANTLLNRRRGLDGMTPVQP